MGHIRFNTKGKVIKVYGTELYRFKAMVYDLAWSHFKAMCKMEVLKEAFVKVPYIYNSDDYQEAIRIFFAVGGHGSGGVIRVPGKTIPVSDVSFNTALDLGGQVIKFMARIGGGCGEHTYFEPENSEWVIGIINKGLNSRLLEREAGWLDLIDLLENTSQPVVASYSTEHWFDSEDMNKDTWDASVNELRESYGGMLEIKPDNFDEYRFGNGVTAGDLITLLEDAKNEAGYNE